MKKLYTTLFTVCVTTASFAQQLPNNGFENWSASKGNPSVEDPTSYTSTNQCYEIVATLTAASETCVNNVEKTTDAHSGSFAAKLTVSANDGAAILTNGDYLTIVRDERYTPIPFAGRPINITAWVKYAPVEYDGEEGTKTDEAEISVVFYDEGSAVAGADIIITSASETYYKIEIPINYNGGYTGTPDGIAIVYFAGEHSGSVLTLDDVVFTYLTTSAYAAISPVTLFTDVQAGNLHFSKNVQEVSFTDMTGNTIQTSGTSTEDVSTAGMKAGLYMVRYTYNSNTYVGKIVLQ